MKPHPVFSPHQLKYALAIRGITQGEVASALGVSKGVLYRQFSRKEWSKPTPRGQAWTDKIKNEIEKRYGIRIMY